MNREDIENIILGMADIVIENRELRKSNEFLRKELNEVNKNRIIENKKHTDTISKCLEMIASKEDKNDNEKDVYKK